MDSNTVFSDKSVTKNEISEYLTKFLLPERLQKLRNVLSQRTRYVTVVIEDLFQPQNISAVMRSCECFGVQDLHIIENQNEIQVHKAVSMGANKWLSIYNYNSENGIKKCVNNLKANNYNIIATIPSNNVLPLEKIPLNKPLALLFGTELTGLSNEAISLADYNLKINMYGFTESLNISNSVAVILSHIIEKIRNLSINFQLSDEEKDILWFEWLQKSIKNPDLLINKYIKEKNKEKNNF